MRPFVFLSAYRCLLMLISLFLSCLCFTRFLFCGNEPDRAFLRRAVGWDETKCNPSFKRHRKPKTLGLRYASSQPTRTDPSFKKPTDLSWLDFSKQQIDATAAAGNKIHFDLTNVSDLNGVLNNSGKYADTITAGELRYIKDSWSRLGDSVKFYMNGIEVKAPWLP